jgi:hypothetical protein
MSSRTSTDSEYRPENASSDAMVCSDLSIANFIIVPRRGHAADSRLCTDCQKLTALHRGLERILLHALNYKRENSSSDGRNDFRKTAWRHRNFR